MQKTKTYLLYIKIFEDMYPEAQSCLKSEYGNIPHRDYVSYSLRHNMHQSYPPPPATVGLMNMIRGAGGQGRGEQQRTGRDGIADKGSGYSSNMNFSPPLSCPSPGSLLQTIPSPLTGSLNGNRFMSGRDAGKRHKHKQQT